jgi:polysaccharide export outer membrane protein
MKSFFFSLCLLAVALGLTACASNNSEPWTRPAVETTAGPEGISASMDEDYRIGAQDLLEVKVFQIKDLDRTVRVDQTGEITLPLIGSVTAGGRTVRELEDNIAALYQESYLQNPRVSVFVKEFASQRVAVTGAVVEPGMFFLSGPTSLLGAVSLAKGPNMIASLSDVALIRTTGGRREGTFYDLDAIIAGQAEDPRIIGGDIVVVQRSGFQQTMQQIMQIAPVFSILPLL